MDEQPLLRPEVAPIVRDLTSAGYQLLVTRRNYALRPALDAWVPTASSLALEPVGSPDDPRLLQVHRSLLQGSLDAHHRAALRTSPVVEVSREEINFMVAADGIESFFLAVDDEGNDVGLVVGAPWGEDRGAVAFFGVCPDFRGCGYAAQLVSG